MNCLTKATLLATFSLLLLGCGSESPAPDGGDGVTEPSIEHINISTQDAVDYAPENRVASIDLTEHVKSDSSASLYIATITPLSSDNGDNYCEIVRKNGLTFDVETNAPQVCRFNYTIEPISSKLSGGQSGISQVVVSNELEAGESLVPISKTTYQAQVLPIDLTTHLPAGFALDNESVELFGTMNNGDIGSVASEGNIITYTAPVDDSGVVQIYYSAVNSTTSSVRPGIIYVSVSYSDNSAPIADINRTIDDIILAGTPDNTFLIDIADYISDIDGDKLQLTDVYTQGLGWAEVHPMSTLFDYMPNASGTHYITYVVTDHRGGWGIGTLNFEVLSYQSIYDSLQGVTFSPTYTALEIAAMHGVYSGLFWENGIKGDIGQYPLFDIKLAEAYCLTKGLSLPTRTQLLSLYNSQLSSISVYTSEYRWPSGARYMATNGVVSLNNGTTSSSLTSAGYLSCVSVNGDPSEYDFSNGNLASDWGETIVVTAAMTLGEFDYQLPTKEYALEYEIISTNPAGLDADVKVTINENKITVAKKIGSGDVKQVTLKVTDPSVQGSAQSDVRLLVGLSQCPLDVSVEETQFLGCVPVLKNTNSNQLYTVSLSDDILLGLGFSALLDNPPSILRKSNTTPNYSYYDPETVFNWPGSTTKSAVGEFAQAYCDMLNDAKVAGRENWSWYQDHVSTDDQYLEGNFASEVTTWMASATGLPTGMVGQGIFSLKLYSHDDYTYQLNQAGSNNFMLFQGGNGSNFNLKQWQFITCTSL